ncbi:ROK family protein [Nocardioides marmorisolisilvae]|uniref:ROK family protein n=1 Tax=Nocardioides marmorisolisilvae TaxID=1542737 RepID=A0A3N0DS60_9ACTN|nr:ROK family protein [Nocardioides marmorisolisilvae]RNL78475.1 ROK family protein [Nocardioides marmorisolisilvae]
MSDECAIAIDIGGTTTKIALIRRNGAIENQVNLPMAGFASVEFFLRELTQAVAGLPSDTGYVMETIGVACPGPVNLRGQTGDLATLPFLSNCDLRSLLSGALERAVRVDHDAKLAVYAEFHTREPASPNLSSIVIGTGVGVGMICDGRVIRGEDNAAGELGHVGYPAASALPQVSGCQCGRIDCLHNALAAPIIARRLGVMIGTVVEPSAVFRLAASGNPHAGVALDEAARALDWLCQTITLGTGIREHVVTGSFGHPLTDVLAQDQARQKEQMFAYKVQSSRLMEVASLVGAGLSILLAPELR